jgi:hypothetical protein
MVEMLRSGLCPHSEAPNKYEGGCICGDCLDEAADLLQQRSAQADALTDLAVSHFCEANKVLQRMEYDHSVGYWVCPVCCAEVEVVSVRLAAGASSSQDQEGPER